MTRKMMITMAALGAFAAASPAAAQWAGNANGNVDIRGLRAEIDAGVSRGDISSQEAYSLRSQLRGLIDLQRRYASDGLSWNERRDLQQRALGLRNEIAQAQGYASGYGGYDNRYNNGEDSYRTYGSGTYNNGYGNGTYNNGTYNNGAYGSGQYGNGQYGTYGNGQSGAYANGQYDRGNRYRDDTSGAYGDTYDDNGGYALRAGDRATGGLYAVPDAYRSRFRDGNNVYYRYGAGNVYQIDARTGVVIRVV
ncbi:MAG: hypothetical protein QOH81_2796, partial [Sphingomonadales bacterium]|nr:hypothetical protein [Sphingomonadales bacterium]